MNTLMLRFPDHLTAGFALAAIDPAATLDIIGEIPGRVGWHVNVRGESAADREALAAYIVEPLEPYRVFA